MADSFKVLEVAHNMIFNYAQDPEIIDKLSIKNLLILVNTLKRVPLGDVAKEISKLDIGIVLILVISHGDYASPMKIFEYAVAEHNVAI